MAEKVVLITGANSGVGLAISKVLSETPEPYHIILTGRSLPKVQTALSELKAASPQNALSALQLEVTSLSSIQAAVSYVQEKFGHLDILINNAGVAMDDADQDAFRATIETNTIGPYLVSSAFRPLLQKAEKGYSIFITSGLGSFACSKDPNMMGHNQAWTSYRASKSALNMVMLQEWLHFGKEGLDVKDGKGLWVFSVCPGFVVSNLRGTSEEARTGGGYATDPMESGKTVLRIIRGERDADAGKIVHKDGIYAF